MSNESTHSYIHYDLERVDFSLSGEELEKLSSMSQNSWKDFCILCLAVGTPCMVNAVVEANKQQQFEATLSFNINLVIGIVGIVLGIAFGIAWWKSRGSVAALIKRIKSKPKVPLTPSLLDVGALKQGDKAGGNA